MSVYAISSAALSHLRPLVVNIVDQNVKEIRRSSNYIDSAEEQKHLNYIANTMESSVETATRALDCKDIINNIKKTSTSNSSLTCQLDEILRKQSEILQISANSLLNSKKHYSQQFMPGGLNNTATTTQMTKSLPFNDDDINTPNDDNDNDEDDTPNHDIMCKDNNIECNNDKLMNDNNNDNNDNDAMDLQQIFNKLQISVQSLKENKTVTIKNVNINNSNMEEKKDELNDNMDDMDNMDNMDNNNKGIFEMRRIWVKSLVLATHFVTAVWLTLKDDVDINDTQSINTKKTPK